MSDSPKPHPRPRPAPHPRPSPVAAATERRQTRAERRRAERKARSRLATFAAAVAVCLAAVGVAAYFVVQASGGAAPRREPPATPTVAARVGAELAQPDVASAFMAGAVSDIAAVTSYDYRTLDEGLSNGLAVTTASYRDSYRRALTGDLAATAVRDHTVQTFDVLRAGIGEISADGTAAKVLVFGQEHVTDSAHAEPVGHPVTLCATIRRDGSSYLISDLVAGANAGLPPGGRELAAAAEAAQREVSNILSFRRSDFAFDYARALTGATGALQREIIRSAPGTKALISKGRYDLRGSVSAVAVEEATAHSVTMLVAASGNRVDDGQETQATDGRYEVTVDYVAGSWTASAITPVVGD